MLQLINTYNGPEILPYETFAYYVSIFGLLTLDRKSFKEKIIDNFDLIVVFNEDKILSDFVKTFYEANYNQFFKSMLSLYEKFISKDTLLNPYKFYLLKQLRLKAY